MFKLKQNNTTVRTELVAGITTFMAMAYILMVNAGMFSTLGGDALGASYYNAVYIATAISAVFGTMQMRSLWFLWTASCFFCSRSQASAGLSLTQYRKLSRLQLHRASVFSLHSSGFRIPESLLTAIPHSLTCTRSTLSSATLHGQR